MTPPLSPPLLDMTLVTRVAEYNSRLKEVAVAFVGVVNEKRATLFRNRGEGAYMLILLLLLLLLLMFVFVLSLTPIVKFRTC